MVDHRDTVYAFVHTLDVGIMIMEQTKYSNIRPRHSDCGVKIVFHHKIPFKYKYVPIFRWPPDDLVPVASSMYKFYDIKMRCLWRERIKKSLYCRIIT